MTTRKQIIKTARQYVGTPFQHLGRTERGLDCVGLIVRVAHDLGLSTFDFDAYSREPDARVFSDVLRGCKDIRRVVPLDAAQPGDIVTIALPSYPCHLAFLSEDSYLIHAFRGYDKVCEHGLNASWKRRIRECYSFRGIK